jgi:hypothetical protein
VPGNAVLSVLFACWATLGPGLVLLLCWRENPGRPGISAPQPARAKDLRKASAGPDIRPAARDAPVPARWQFPAAAQRTGGLSDIDTDLTAPDHANTFEAHRAHPTQPSITTAPRPGPAGQR